MFSLREQKALGAVLDQETIVMRLANRRVLIDVADLEDVAFAPGKWVLRPNSTGYPRYVALDPMNKRGPRRLKSLHIYLTGWDFVDHINGNIYDNRRKNLRKATPRQNSYNTKLSVRNTSGYKGVSRSGYKFVAQVKHEDKTYMLGLFDTAKEAAHAYDNAAVQKFGEFAALNFPRPGHRWIFEDTSF